MEEYLFNESLIHTRDIAISFSNVRKMDNKIKKMVESERIQKIKNGLYALINPITCDIFANKYEIASALFDNSCIAYHSALEFYGLHNQIFSDVFVYSKNRASNFYFDGLTYKFYQTNIKCGIITFKQNSKITITSLERTIIDCIDRINLAGGIEEVCYAISGITYLNEAILVECLEEYNEKLLYKKVGFLFSKFNKDILSNNFFELCHSKIASKTDNICENKLLPKKSDKYWRIVYPSTIINTEN